jgi:hypothetical protein
MQELQDLIDDVNFVEKVTAALENPDTPEGSRFIRQIERLIHLSAREVPFLAMERKAAISKLYSMVHFFGSPSWFVTVSAATVSS